MHLWTQYLKFHLSTGRVHGACPLHAQLLEGHTTSEVTPVCSWPLPGSE